jgi:hypothetical protein
MNPRVALTLLLCSVLPSAVAAPSLPAIDRYEGIYTTLRAAESPQSLQPLFDAAQAVQEALMTIDESDYAWLERLDDGEAEAVQARLPGLRLHRGYDVHVSIDAAAMIALARDHGRPEDLAFFERYAASHSEQFLPIYLRYTDRAAPCVRFDETVLGDQYQLWREFHVDYPLAYRAFVRTWLSDIEDVMRHGTCTCTETQAPVETSLSAFIERFPDTPVRAEVESRLQQLRERPHEKPVWCR